MLERIPTVMLRNRPLVLIAALVLLAVGVWSARQLPVDVYPNLNAPVVTVVAEHHGMAPEEIEALVTFPLESAFNSLPHVIRVRSASLPGISLVYVDFDYGTDIYFARQLVAEKLQMAAARLPEGVEPPFMGPVSSMFADAVEFTLPVGDDPFEARDLAEWTIRMVEARTLGVFNAMGPASELTMGGMLDGIQGGIGSKARLVWAPTDFLEQQKVSPWGDMPVWIPATGDTAGANRRRNQKAIAAGLTFRPLPETARDTLAWWKALPADRQAELRAGIAPDREQQVLEAWKAKRG